MNGQHIDMLAKQVVSTSDTLLILSPVITVIAVMAIAFAYAMWPARRRPR